VGVFIPRRIAQFGLTRLRFLLGQVRGDRSARAAAGIDQAAEYDFEGVSPTALAPVIARGEFSDIPFAREMLGFLQERCLSMPADFLAAVREHAFFFEARFKAVSRMLAEEHASQICELAAGFSPRALDPAFGSTTYVEVDLPKIIAQKRAIVLGLLGSIPAHLQFGCANVLHWNELAPCLRHFRQEPVAVVAEGLLRYLTLDEKARLADNVKSILRIHGGVWITPDILLREWEAPGLDKKLGRDVGLHHFDDMAQARAFFEGCGFHVEDRPLLAGIRERVVSLPRAAPGPLAVMESRRIFRMTLAG